MIKRNMNRFTIEVRKSLAKAVRNNCYLNVCCLVSEAICARVPNAITMRNQIPKNYVDYDLYCNLIPNENENVDYF